MEAFIHLNVICVSGNPYKDQKNRNGEKEEEGKKKIKMRKGNATTVHSLADRNCYTQDFSFVVFVLRTNNCI